MTDLKQKSLGELEELYRSKRTLVWPARAAVPTAVLTVCNFQPVRMEAILTG